jgi:hypothetical protein
VIFSRKYRRGVRFLRKFLRRRAARTRLWFRAVTRSGRRAASAVRSQLYSNDFKPTLQYSALPATPLVFGGRRKALVLLRVATFVRTTMYKRARRRLRRQKKMRRIRRLRRCP